MGKSLPFSNRPDARSYFPYPIHEQAYRQLNQGIVARKGLIILTSAEGTGKTLLLRRFIQTARSNKGLRIHLFESPWRDAASALEAIGRAHECNVKHVSVARKKARVRERLAKLHTNGVAPVLLIDNATFIDFEVLDVLLELVDASETGLQVVLSGESELGNRLQLNKSDAWERATRIQLKHFDQAGTSQYIDHQMHLAGLESHQLFSQNTVDRIQSYSGGIPVKINNLCNIALSLNKVGQNNARPSKKLRGPRAPVDSPREPGRLYVDASSRHAKVDRRPLTSRLGSLVPFVAVTMGALAVVYVTNRGDLPSGFTLPVAPGGDVAEQLSTPGQALDAPLPRADSVSAAETVTAPSTPVDSEIAAPAPAVEGTETVATAEASAAGEAESDLPGAADASVVDQAAPPEAGLSVVLNDAWERITGWFESPPADSNAALESDVASESAPIEPEVAALAPAVPGTESVATAEAPTAAGEADSELPAAADASALVDATATPAIEETETNAVAEAPEPGLSVVLNDAWERVTGWFESPPVDSSPSLESAVPESALPAPEVADSESPIAGAETIVVTEPARKAESELPDAADASALVDATATPEIEETETNAVAEAPEPGLSVVLNDAWERVTGWFESPPAGSSAAQESEAAQESALPAPDIASHTPPAREPTLADAALPVTETTQMAAEPDPDPAIAGSSEPEPGEATTSADAISKDAIALDSAPEARDAAEEPGLVERIRIAATELLESGAPDAVVATDEPPPGAEVQSAGSEAPDTEIVTPESTTERAGETDGDTPVGLDSTIAESGAEPVVGTSAVIEPGAPDQASGEPALSESHLYSELREPTTATAASTTVDSGATVGGKPEEAMGAREPAVDARAVTALLKRASRQVAREQLTLPAGANALDTYREVLRLDPDNRTATQGMADIKARYREWAGYAAERGEWDTVARYYQRALKVDPEDPELLSKLKQVRNRGPSRHASTSDAGRAAALAKLERAGKSVTPTVLADSAMNGDLGTAKLLLQAGLNADSDVDAYGYTALMFAAMNGYPELVGLLLDHGADVNRRSEDGRTALMVAAWNGHDYIVRYLISRGADVNIRNEESWTALTHAAWKGHQQIAQTLLDHGADPRVRNRDGWTAMDSARKRGHGTIVQLIRRYTP